MKQIPRPDHPAILKSIAVCTVASAIIAADALSPIQPAGADNYAYSKVERHCESSINRNAVIDLGWASQIEAATGQSIDSVGLTGINPYCWLPDKTAPNGAMSQAAVFGLSTGPIDAPPQVLVVYFAMRASDGIYTITGTERWDVSNPDWRDRFAGSLEGQQIRLALEAVQQPFNEACR